MNYYDSHIVNYSIFNFANSVSIIIYNKVTSSNDQTVTCFIAPLTSQVTIMPCQRNPVSSSLSALFLNLFLALAHFPLSLYNFLMYELRHYFINKNRFGIMPPNHAVVTYILTKSGFPYR
jgi:hypothetical protein